jgi:hypothetical protein
MKTHLYLFSMMLLAVICCESPREKETDYFYSFNSQRVDQSDTALMNDFKGDPFHISSAAKLGSFLLNRNSGLRNIAKEYSYGGVFDAALFNLDGVNKNAIRFWYCYNPHDDDFPVFFLAAEQIKYDFTAQKPNPEDETLMNAELTVPETFTYAPDNSRRATVQQFLLDHETKQANTLSIEKAKVLEYSENFMSLVSIISPADDELFCQYRVAIFEKNKPYDDFMGRQPKLIRYYMGLGMDEIHEPNYLRPILAGVKPDGTTLRETGDATIGAFLQKSVPPPPFQ